MHYSVHYMKIQNQLFTRQNSFKESEKNSKKWIWVTSLIILIVITLLLVPIFPVVDVTTEEKTIERELDYIIYANYTNIAGSLDKGPIANQIVIMKNIDKIGGNFSVKHMLLDNNGLIDEEITTQYMEPDATKTFIYAFEIERGQKVLSKYTVISPTIIDDVIISSETTQYETFLEYLVNI